MVAKKKVANKLNTTLFDLIDIYKAVKPSHLEKLQIIQNVNKLMFQGIFIFPDWILIEQIIASSNPSTLGVNRFSKNFTWSFRWGTGTWVKMIHSIHFWGMWTPWTEKFFQHMLEYTSQRKFNKHSGEIKP